MEKELISELNWNDMYEITKNYFEHYGDLSADPNFKTINGIDEDENGINLLNWIESQRKKIRSRSMINFFMGNDKISESEKNRIDKLKQLTDEQVLSLVCIGFRIDTFQENHDKVRDLLNRNGITNTAVIFSLRMRSYTELLAIIDYLTSNNLEVQVDGKPNDMFYMNGDTMKEVYGFYKHELISSYIASLDKEEQKKLVL